jgi:uncharacterized OB-fold protein
MSTTPNTAGKQIPHPSELDYEFFAVASRTGRLHVQRCSSCGDHHHPPRLYCPSCFSGEFDFSEVSGRGVVYSHTVSHYSAEKAWREMVPFATIVVELEEGPRVVGSARGFEVEDIKIGVPVRVMTESVAEDFAYLWVEPA